MKTHFRLIHRGERGNQFYCVDSQTGRRFSLKTKDRDAAEQIVLAKNQSLRQPALNLQIAKAYLFGTDKGIGTRTWQHVMEEIIRTKSGENQVRWQVVAKSRKYDPIRNLLVVETQAEHFLHVLQAGSVSTNVYLRRMHNFALDMNWLPASVIPRRQWPPVHFKEKRAITLDEHQKIIAAEKNPERKAHYQLCWHLGASQGDIASLKGEDVDWQNSTVSFTRKKTGVPVIVHLGGEALNVFKDLPSEGLLFPYLSGVRAGDRATEFGQRCRRLGIHGVTLHSYRYAWAERAKTVGYPERFAQEALGHNSKAVHRAYAKRALMKLPSLEDYELQAAAKFETPV
ncbi:MAG: tyrosine-type recombinase/integrase [Verrucomicrobiota bacterium]